MKKNPILIICLMVFVFGCNSSGNLRKIISLDGEWNIAESIDGKSVPDSFNAVVPVPGLVDLAQPAFAGVGLPSDKRNFFWYSKTIDADDIYDKDVVLLKLHKALYSPRIYINNQLAGENPFCFTPTILNIKPFLKRGKNEIVIRIYSYKDLVPDTIPVGTDIEKVRYIPGIYDDVELIGTNYPLIKNIQVVPDVENKRIRVVAWIGNDTKPKSCKPFYIVRESKSGKTMVSGVFDKFNMKGNGNDSLDFTVAIPDCRLWSPEDPFLYEIVLSTGGDDMKVRFGMRTFRFDPNLKRAMLNGKPYFLLGTNINLHRFFEDSLRGTLPWNKEWVRKMHQEFKKMNWNAYRMCIGFAPDWWYDIADEEGFLIQDEYDLWGVFLSDSTRFSTREFKRHKASVLALEYAAWMRERWNHPSLAIWDAQNETLWGETGKAIQMVRHLDLSNRPWDNGFSAPQCSTDVLESHPYQFLGYIGGIEKPGKDGPLKDKMACHPSLSNDPSEYDAPKDGSKFPNAVLVNEYCALFLYRDGSPTKVCEKLFTMFPGTHTPEKRFELRYLVLAAKTEYWRTYPSVAGVLYFCSLTCDRKTGILPSVVSDEWMDVKNLKFHPLFIKYVKPAFSPVAMMVDFWEPTAKPGQKFKIPVYLINDLYEDWQGVVTLAVVKGDEIINSIQKKTAIKSLTKNPEIFEISMPNRNGEYDLMASLIYRGDTVISVRKVTVK
jgi:beta-galactosidase